MKIKMTTSSHVHASLEPVWSVHVSYIPYVSYILQIKMAKYIWAG